MKTVLFLLGFIIIAGLYTAYPAATKWLLLALGLALAGRVVAKNL